MPKIVKEKNGKKRKNKGMHKPKVFELYVLWKSLPPILMKENDGVLDALAINDESIRELLKIESQTRFCKKYKVNKATLSLWNRKIDDDDPLYFERRKWVKKLLSNVIVAVYRKALVEGDAQRARFLAEFAGEITKGMEVRDPESEKQTELLRKIAERR